MSKTTVFVHMSETKERITKEINERVKAIIAPKLKTYSGSKNNTLLILYGTLSLSLVFLYNI